MGVASTAQERRGGRVRMGAGARPAARRVAGSTRVHAARRRAGRGPGHDRARLCCARARRPAGREPGTGTAPSRGCSRTRPRSAPGSSSTTPCALPDSAENEDALRFEARSLDALARRAERLEVTIAIENLAPLYPGPETLSARPHEPAQAGQADLLRPARPLPGRRPRPHHSGATPDLDRAPVRAGARRDLPLPRTRQPRRPPPGGPPGGGRRSAAPRPAPAPGPRDPAVASGSRRCWQPTARRS